LSPASIGEGLSETKFERYSYTPITTGMFRQVILSR
jgi:hypothetical protein